MVEICADDFALPIEDNVIPTQNEENDNEENVYSCFKDADLYASVNLSDFFQVKYKLLRHDISIFMLYGKLFTFNNKYDAGMQKKRKLFTDFYLNYPLAESYTVQWHLDVKTPVLLPGAAKCSNPNFGNPTRIINSYLRSQAQ